MVSNKQVCERAAAERLDAAVEIRSEIAPLVSVIMPAYNSERFIEQAVRSVRMQTMQRWEMIIVDDCSTDKTAEQIKRLAAEDPRIIPVYSESNHGAAESRNIALRQCRGEFVALLMQMTYGTRRSWRESWKERGRRTRILFTRLML